MKLISRLCYLFVIFTLVHSFSASASSISTKNDDVLLEIIDKYNQVRLGITNHSVYMILDDTVLENLNSKLNSSYKLEMELFNDSAGNFVPTNHTYIATNTIEVELDDIADVAFNNGKLSFSYNSNQAIYFADVEALNGKQALDNFYVEDLERFFLTLMRFTSLSKP